MTIDCFNSLKYFQNFESVINSDEMKPGQQFSKAMLLLAILLIACISATCGKGDKSSGGKDKPAAEAKQSITTPTLKPSEKKADEAKEKREQPVAKPKGPITLPPSTESAPSEPAIEEKAADVGGVALESLSKDKDKGKGSEEGIRSLAAPKVEHLDAKSLAEAQPIPYSPTLVKSKTNIDIILDASGSMQAPFGATSKSKFEMVREALREVLYELVEQQQEFPRNVGIRLFGDKYPAVDNNCTDSDVVLAMGDPDLDVIKEVLSKVKPQGTSPIAYALEKAPKDFPDGQLVDSVIVLIADGSDNCGRNACDAVKKIVGIPNSPLIHVVAFDVNPSDQEKLSCIAKTGGGKVYIARNENELRSTLSEAINSTVPYNLKLTARAGATPLPFNLTVFKAGTQRAVKRDKSAGSKLLSLEPGIYDILIEYANSPEPKKPSKILKGVEILATTRVEQTVTFDLGQLTLSAIDNDGKLVPARFEIIATSAGPEDRMAAQLETGAESSSIFLTPGSYDITANLMEMTPEGFALSENNIPIKTGETTERTFRFQKGILALKGITTQEKEISFLFQAFKEGLTNAPVASGAFNRTGGTVYLVPGKYDILAIGTDPSMIASPRTRVKAIEIKPAGTTEVTINFEMGILKLSAVDGKDNKLPAEFIIRDHDDQMLMAKIKSESGSPVSVAVPPGTYDVVAVSLRSELEPRPSVPAPTLKVDAKKPTEEVIKFILGTIRLRGRNAKELAISTKFTIYRAGSEEIVSSAPPTTDWVVFELAPGRYDALAINETASEDSKKMIWLRDIRVEDGKTASHEAIYTTGRLKIIGRGPNNRLISCRFKVFEYGADRELVNGMTGDDWEIFEIEPGKYYLEASYYNEDETTTFKKWINITIGDNEVVEQILRF